MSRLVAVLALAGALVASSPRGVACLTGSDDGQIELRSDVVLVNVVAKRGNGFAAGLERKDFTISEDGAPQEVAFFGAEDTPFAAAVLLDTSGSMEHKLTVARAAVARFADRTRRDDRLAVFAFADSVKQVQEFGPGRREVSDALWDMVADGNTKMFDCVDEAVAALEKRSEQRRAIVLLSDGGDSGSRVSRDKALNRALAAGVTFYTIDLRPSGGQSSMSKQDQILAYATLKTLADKSGGRFFTLSGGSDLDAAFGEIVDELGHQYTLGYYPTNQRRDGKYRRIGVTTTQQGVALRARPGYTAPKE
jgi:Ca-activated chloride channel family protein